MPNQYSSLNYNEEKNNDERHTSLKQLFKKLKYAKERYYMTHSRESKEILDEIKLKIIMFRGIKSKYINKDFMTYEMKKQKEDKMNKERIKKQKKKRGREKKRERNRIKKEKEKLKAKAQRDKAKAYREEWERRRAKAKQEEKERRRAKAKQEEKKRSRAKAKQEEWENLVPKIEKSIINIPDDVIEFKKNPSRKTYFKLSKKYHPDKGGNDDIMKEINNTWDDCNSY